MHEGGHRDHQIRVLSLAGRHLPSGAAILEAMDDESKRLLIQIRDLQLEQLELIRKIYSGVPPWLTWRFGVRHLLVAMTVFAVILGILVVTSG
jgi:hypothetical protein